MSERTAIVIPLPLSVVESNIWDVTSWPTFLAGVEWVRRTSHERYIFAVRHGRRIDEVLVAVRWHGRDHRVTWRELEGPAFRGEIRLTSLNGRRTRVSMTATVHPRNLWGTLTEMIGGGRHDVSSDLRRLADRLSTIPQPFNPTRLTPIRQVGARVVTDPARVQAQEAIRRAVVSEKPLGGSVPAPQDALA